MGKRAQTDEGFIVEVTTPDGGVERLKVDPVCECGSRWDRGGPRPSRRACRRPAVMVYVVASPLLRRRHMVFSACDDHVERLGAELRAEGMEYHGDLWFDALVPWGGDEP